MGLVVAENMQVAKNSLMSQALSLRESRLPDTSKE